MAVTNIFEWLRRLAKSKQFVYKKLNWQALDVVKSEIVLAKLYSKVKQLFIIVSSAISYIFVLFLFTVFFRFSIEKYSTECRSEIYSMLCSKN